MYTKYITSILVRREQMYWTINNSVGVINGTQDTKNIDLVNIARERERERVRYGTVERRSMHLLIY